MICRGCGRDLGDTDYCPACDGERLYEGKSIIKKYNIFTAYISMFKNHGDYTGRCRRSEYWLAMFANIIVAGMAFCGMYFLPMLYGGGLDMLIYIVSGFCQYFFVAYVCIMIIPMVSVTVRRVHDVGKSAWWVTGIGTLLFFWLWITVKFISVLFLIAGLLMWIYLTVQDSQVGINKYGPNRKGVE